MFEQAKTICFILSSQYYTTSTHYLFNVDLVQYSTGVIVSYYVIVHRCGTGGSMRACHAAGPGSIPGRDKFPG